MKPKLLATTLLATLLILASGCSMFRGNPNQGPMFTFVVQADATVTNLDFPVALVLVNSNNSKVLAGMSTQEYFSVDGKRPEGLEELARFDMTRANHTPHQIKLKKSQRFNYYTQVLVLANIPVEVTGNLEDPRRRELPLDGKKWPPKTDRVTVTLTGTRIIAYPAPLE